MKVQDTHAGIRIQAPGRLYKPRQENPSGDTGHTHWLQKTKLSPGEARDIYGHCL